MNEVHTNRPLECMTQGDVNLDVMNLTLKSKGELSQSN